MPTFASLFFRELAELHKANASRASEAEEAALSRDMQAKEQLTLALEKAQEEARIQQEALADQVTQRWQNKGAVCLLRYVKCWRHINWTGETQHTWDLTV